MQRFHKTLGFSLLELLAVVTILGIISSIVLSRVSHHALDAKKKSCLQYKADINSAIELYRFDTGSFPLTVDQLEGTYYPEQIPKCPVTNLEYEIDATAGRVLGHDH
jgi:general secretion pathway protein G